MLAHLLHDPVDHHVPALGALDTRLYNGRVWNCCIDMCVVYNDLIKDDLAEVESVGPDVNESVEGDEYEEDDEDRHDNLGIVDHNGHCTTRAVNRTLLREISQ